MGPEARSKTGALAQRRHEQGRPEQEDQGRTAEGTNRPNGFGEGTAPASEPQGVRASRAKQQQAENYPVYHEIQP